MNIIDEEPLIDALVRSIKKNGGTVELLSDQTEEGEQLKNSFGGYAAILE